jgi:hypothetical protein
LAMAGLYTYIVATPFVFIELFHVAADHFRIVFWSKCRRIDCSLSTKCKA